MNEQQQAQLAEVLIKMADTVQTLARLASNPRDMNAMERQQLHAVLADAPHVAEQAQALADSLLQSVEA